MEKEKIEEKESFFSSWKFVIILFLIALFFNAISSFGGSGNSNNDRYDYDSFDYKNERQVEDILERKPEDNKSWFEN